ncbi:MAG: hypothetical protein LBG08_09390 [Spirochaetaceae bacterium]|jgi:hypothetical protein|nr:hypothetical protein [Spirochaetaceae bacterium]
MKKHPFFLLMMMLWVILITVGIYGYNLSLFQNPVGFGTNPWKNRSKPNFSTKPSMGEDVFPQVTAFSPSAAADGAAIYVKENTDGTDDGVSRLLAGMLSRGLSFINKGTRPALLGPTTWSLSK